MWAKNDQSEERVMTLQKVITTFIVNYVADLRSDLNWQDQS